MMKVGFRDIFLLAVRRKSRKERIWYFLKGIVFLPFLIWASRQVKTEEDLSASMSAAGDDIYPLF